MLIGHTAGWTLFSFISLERVSAGWPFLFFFITKTSAYFESIVRFYTLFTTSMIFVFACLPYTNNKYSSLFSFFFFLAKEYYTIPSISVSTYINIHLLAHLMLVYEVTYVIFIIQIMVCAKCSTKWVRKIEINCRVILICCLVYNERKLCSEKNLTN